MSPAPHFDFFEIFRSVEIAWGFWLFGIGVLLILLIRYRSLLSGNRFFIPFRKRMATFHSDQDGASYSLAFLITLPFILGLIVLIIETSFLLVAKFGTMHAAYMSARSAIVWTTSDHKDVPVTNGNTYFDNFPKARSKAEEAAIRAMVPFSSGLAAKKLKYTDAQQKNAANYLQMYRDFTLASEADLRSYKWKHKIRIRPDYVRNKFLYASRATQVKLSGQSEISNPEPWQLGLEARVTYEYPYSIAKIPFFGLFVGERTSDGRYVYKVQSTVMFPNECPKNPTAKLGITL